MHQLLQTSSAERCRIVDEFVSRAFADIPADATGAAIAHAMRSLPPELPEEPSDAQVEAWLELLAVLADGSFAARVREMAVAGAAAQLPQPLDMAPLREHAGQVLALGVDPASPAADAAMARILPSDPQLSAAERVQLRERLQTFNDVRVERYWQPTGALNGRPPFPPIAAACAWCSAARARVSPTRSRGSSPAMRGQLRSSGRCLVARSSSTPPSSRRARASSSQAGAPGARTRRVSWRASCRCCGPGAHHSTCCAGPRSAR